MADTGGELHAWLLQSNMNQFVKMLVFKELCELFDKKDPDWRDRNILLQDNAKYNTGNRVSSYLKFKKLPLLFASPYTP